MYYGCIIYVLSMYYLCIVCKWESNGTQTGTECEPEVRTCICIYVKPKDQKKKDELLPHLRKLNQVYIQTK